MNAIEQDDTATIIADVRHGNLPRHLRGLVPASQATPTGRAVLQACHEMRLAFISNPLVHDAAWRGWSKQQHKTLIRLLLGGFVQVFRVDGPLPGEHPSKRVGAHAEAHYLLRVPSLATSSESNGDDT